MCTVNTKGSPKITIKHIKYNGMKNNISRREAWRVVKLWIMVDQYNPVTSFGEKGQEVPLTPPSKPWQEKCPAHCLSVNAICLTYWRGSTGTMEIVALLGSTILSLRSFLASIFSFITYLFHSEKVPLSDCPSWSSESLYF